MQAYITYSCQQTGGKYKTTCDQVVTIGRDKHNVVCLKDPMVSRNHTIIRAVGHNGFYVLDAGSRNGTYLNGRRVAEPIRLNNGDEILAGDTPITFNCIESPLSVGSSDVASFDAVETLVNFKPEVQSTILLVADIRGYTSMSEQMTVTDLTKVMAFWFQKVQELVEAHGGIVDKFIGDCVLAFWELGEVSTGNNAKQVLNTALEIHRLTDSLPKLFKQIPGHPRIGVGINQGDVALTYGMADTIMGDAVNTAFRLESATKDMETDVVMNSTFYKELKAISEYGQLSGISVKGKADELKVLDLKFDALRAYLNK